jgi:hypothetical protein
MVCLLVRACVGFSGAGGSPPQPGTGPTTHQPAAATAAPNAGGSASLCVRACAACACERDTLVGRTTLSIASPGTTWWIVMLSIASPGTTWRALLRISGKRELESGAWPMDKPQVHSLPWHPSAAYSRLPRRTSAATRGAVACSPSCRRDLVSSAEIFLASPWADRHSFVCTKTGVALVVR